ncbi:MAG TPA: hypothetical protein DCZ95_00555 [Verrucomicrobia bacterium]|nr:MAG: hypothetical protein A2X46_05805 [Lentisphaerae bacterium GWF2_57_35]HBA82560.1 hypothetical protein [Verrucomicrobiota bacterium]
MCLAVFLSSLSGIATLPCRAEENLNTPYKLKLSINWAQMNGYAQTPMGGKPGTSDLERPTFDELNMDDSFFYDMSLSRRFGRNEVYLGGQLIRLLGKGVLEENLMTRIAFEANESFTSDLQFDWIRLGVARWYRLGELPIWWALRAEMAMLDFKYTFETPSDSIERSYSKLTGRLGLDVKWELNPRLHLEAAAAASIPLSNSPDITTADLSVHYRLLKNPRSFSPEVFAGVGMMVIDYEDNQTLPNHIRLEAKPIATVGVEFKF